MPWPTYSRTTAKPGRVDRRLDRGADVAEAVAGDASRRSPASSAARVTSISRCDSASIVADRHRDRGVGVPALDDRPAVDRHDVAVLEHAVAGDAVHDHLVRRDAGHRREAVVAEEVRAGAAAVEHVARGARRDRRSSRPGTAARAHASCISATTAPGPPHQRDLRSAVLRRTIDAATPSTASCSSTDASTSRSNTSSPSPTPSTTASSPRSR